MADVEVWPATDLGNGEMLAVMDASGEMFCYVQLNDCAGMDRAAAKARATRIAEALNVQEGHSKPVPYVDAAGNLCAPAGYGFVAKGGGCEMVPLVNVTVVPAVDMGRGQEP